jgi:hypothetical protein
MLAVAAVKVNRVLAVLSFVPATVNVVVLQPDVVGVASVPYRNEGSLTATVLVWARMALHENP